MRRLSVMLLAAMMLLPGSALAGAQATPSPAFSPALDDADLAAFSRFVETAMTGSGVPGAAVVIVQDGQIRAMESFGVRELGGTDPVDDATLMMVGSVTKSMTSMMMASLVDDGLIAWDEPAVAAMPEFRVASPGLTADLTLQDLLCACTGIPRHDLDVLFDEHARTPGDMLRSLARYDAVAPPGETYQYVNQVYAAGGYLAAMAAGGSLATVQQDYERLMQERVFDPIGMTGATFDPLAVAASPDHASPHGRTLAGEPVALPIAAEAPVLPMLPAGGAWMTIRDLAAYLQTELAVGVAPDGTRIVSAAELARTWEPRTRISDNQWYGLGWSQRDLQGQPLVLHDGGSLGFTSRVAFLPESGLGIAFMTNVAGSRSFSEALTGRWLELAFDQPESAAALLADQLAGEAPQRAIFADPSPADPAAFAGWLGTWRNPDLGDFTLESAGESVILRNSVVASTLIQSPIPGHGSGDLLTATPPWIGVHLTLTERGGDRVIELHDLSSDRVYPFTRK